jgi:molybdopterin converting factor small subunit
MAVIFLIPTPLRPFTEEASKIPLEVSAATVGEALGGLWARYPGVRDRVVTEQGEVREYINIFVGSENIRDSGGLATPVQDGSEIMIVPSVAGGVS